MLCELLLVSSALIGQNDIDAVISRPSIENISLYSVSDKEFEIISNDENQPKYVLDNIHFIKRSILSRWSLPNSNFTKKCVIVCINDIVLYKKLFPKNDGKAFYKYDAKRMNDDVSAIWLFLGGSWRDSDLPRIFTLACLSEYSITKNVEIPHWLRCGISELNSTEQDIQYLMNIAKNSISNNKFNPDIESIMANKDAYDDSYMSNCMLLCLFLKKEFPDKNIFSFLHKKSDHIIRSYGFSDYNEMNFQFEKYVFNLMHDMTSGRLPSSYILDIFVP